MKLLVSGYGEGEKKGLFEYKINDEGQLMLLHNHKTSGYPTHTEVVDNYWFVSMKPDSKDTGGLAVFRDGSLLTELFTPGVSYAHLCVCLPYIYAISYHEGHISSFSFEDNKLKLISDIVHETKENNGTLKIPHPHYVGQTLDKEYIYCVDLGRDEIIFYTSSKGILEKAYALKTDCGSGPRQLVFSHNNKLGYLVTETANTIDVYRFGDKKMDKLQSLKTVPEDYQETSHLAAVKLNDSEELLLVSNRGHDSVALYDIGVDGLLKLKKRIVTGRTPRDAVFVGKDFLVVAAQDSDVLQVYHFSGDDAEKIEEVVVASPVDIAVF